MMHEISWADAAAFANTLADTARPLAMAHFRGAFETAIKADGSPVTIADREVEQALRTRIGDRYPDHGIYGEEFGAIVRATTWVIDPIDGTKSFVTGMPLFGTLIALVTDGIPRIGVIDMPALDERWLGTPDGTWLNGAATRTSGCTRLQDAKVQTTSPDRFSREGWSAFERLGASAALRRFGGDCYAYGLLASGYVDAVVEENLAPYDFMALVAVVRGAGGVITDWSGRALDFASAGRVAAASTPALHRETLAVLNGG